MGRRALPDEEKRAKGTLDSRYTAGARSERAASNIVAFPSISTIPEPEIPLNEVGRKKYDELSKMLFEAGRLDQSTLMRLTAISLQWQIIQSKAATDATKIRASEMKSLHTELDKLQIAAAAKPVSAGMQPATVNKFARGVGAAKRHR